MAATVTKGVKYRQAECTWVFYHYSSQRFQSSNTQHRRALGLRGRLQQQQRQMPGVAIHSDTLHLHLGRNEDNSNSPNWSARLDLLDGLENQEPGNHGLQVGLVTLQPLLSLTSISPGELNVVICVVDMDGVEAFETTAERDTQTRRERPIGYGYDDQSKAFRFGLPGTEMMRNQQLYLPNDTLRIKANITLCDTKSDGPAPSPLSVVYTSSTSRLVKLSKDMLGIKNSGLQSDFEIICSGTTFPVHQAILAARSQYFATMLGTDMKEKNERKLIDDDCDPQTMKILLEYIYSSNIEIEKLGSELISSLTKAADKYQLEELKDICFTHMVKSLSLETAGNVAVTAYLYSAPKTVRETVFQFCAKNWQTLASSNEFQAINAAWPKAFHKP